MTYWVYFCCLCICDFRNDHFVLDFFFKSYRVSIGLDLAKLTKLSNWQVRPRDLPVSLTLGLQACATIPDFILFIFRIYLIFNYMCMCVCMWMWVQVPIEARRGYQIWNWLWAINMQAGNWTWIFYKSSKRVNCYTIPPALHLALWT